MFYRANSMARVSRMTNTFISPGYLSLFLQIFVGVFVAQADAVND